MARKILLIAEAANPEWTSVPLVGWSLSLALLRRNDAHLVTQVRNRSAIERSGLIDPARVSFIDTEWLAKPLNSAAKVLTGGKAWTLNTAIGALAYYEFERRVWREFGSRLKAGEFDIVHRITPLSPVVPSLIAGKCRKFGAKFVLGPLNGGVPWPAGFRHARHAEREWLSYVRSAYKLLPGYRSTRQNSNAMIIASQHSLSLESKIWRSKCIYLPENAVDPRRFSRRVSIPDAGPLRACFVGRLVPYKGADMLIEAAMPLVQCGLLELDIAGDGPQMAQLRQMIDAESCLGVRIHGWLRHDEVQDIMAESHVFAFPSIREFGGGVVLEAMAVGAVPIVVDYAGPGELVTESTGLKVPLGDRNAIIAELRKTLAWAVANRATLREKSAASISRAHQLFTWDAKAEQVGRVYEWVRGNAAKPELL